MKGQLSKTAERRGTQQEAGKVPPTWLIGGLDPSDPSGRGLC